MSQTPFDVPDDPRIPPDPQPAPAPKPKRRRWPFILLSVLLILVLLVVCAPMLASTAPLRSIILGQLNKNLDGRVSIADWSLGWTSGIKIFGLKIYDERNAEILDVPRLTTELTLLEALRGNYQLGETQIEVANLVARIDESGRSNFEKLPKTEAIARKPPKGGPTEIPNVSGKLNVKFRGTIEAAGYQTVHIEPSTAVVNIADINKPIDNDVKLSFRVGDESPGSIALAGTVDAVENNRLTAGKLTADQKVELMNVNLAAAAPFLKQGNSKDTQIGGVANGSVHAVAQGIAGISTDGQIVVTNFMFGGETLNGDIFRTERISIPLQITRTSVDPNTTLIKIEKLGVQMPEATVSITGEVTQESIQRVIENKPPGTDGRIDYVLDIPDVSRIANQLPNSLQLAEGVQLTGGKFNQTSSFVLSKDQVALSERIDLAAAGTRAGKPINLRPIHVEVDAHAIPAGGPIPDIRNIKLLLQSEFAKVTGAGESIAALKLDAQCDLDMLTRELRQFSDLGQLQLAGNVSFSLATSGDVTKIREGRPVDATFAARLENLNITGLSNQPPLKLSSLTIDSTANLVGSKSAFVDTVQVESLTIRSSERGTPVIDLAANAKVKVVDQTVPQFALVKFEMPNLASAQAQFGTFVPALRQQNLIIREGRLSARTSGSFDGKTVTLVEPLVVSMPGLTIVRENQPVVLRETIQLTIGGAVGIADGISAHLTELSATSSSNLFTVTKAAQGPFIIALDGAGAIRGNGALTISSDLKRANDVARAFGGEIGARGSSAGELRAGRLDATLRLSETDQKQTTLKLDGNITQLSVATHQNPIENEKVGITFVLISPIDDSPISATGKISSSFATTTILDTKLKLNAGVWDIVQWANVDVNVPDLQKLYNVISAFTPPAAVRTAARYAPSPGTPGEGWGEGRLASFQQDPVRGDERISTPRKPRDRADEAASLEKPLEPLRIVGGSMGMQINLARDTKSSTTNLSITDGRINKLSIQRGQGKPYRFDRDEPITFKLNAVVQASDDKNDATGATDEIKSIAINDLAADVRVASLSMPQRLQITGPLSKPTASGSIRVDGSLDKMMPVLSLLQDKPPMPYGGDFSLIQKIDTAIQEDDTVLNLQGRLSAPRFVVLDEKNNPLVEDQLEMKNNLGVYLDRKIATVRSLSISMPKSNALALDVTGRMLNWDSARQIRDAKLDLKYDLEKLWTIVFPMLDPELQKSYKDLKIAGKHQTTITLAGAFPAKPTLAESMRSLDADGSIAIAMLDLPQGLTIQNFDLPVEMRKGIVRVQPGNLPEQPPPPTQDTHDGKSKSPLLDLLGGDDRRSAAEDQPRAPEPKLSKPETAWCNRGLLNLAALTVDLTQPTPLISIPKDKRILQSVRLNPVLADTLGGANLLFKNASDATGLLDVTVVECNQVPAGDFVAAHPRARASILFDVIDLKLDGPVPGLLSQALNLGGRGIEGEIRKGSISLADGIATSEFALNLTQFTKVRDRSGQKRTQENELPMQFKGGVVLASGQLKDFFVNIPSELIPAQLGGRDIRKLLPNGLRVPFTGTTSKPNFNFQKALTDTLGQNLLSPEGLGGILDQLGGKKDKEKGKER